MGTIIYLCILLLATVANMLSCFWLVKHYISSRKASNDMTVALFELIDIQQKHIGMLEELDSHLMKILGAEEK